MYNFWGFLLQTISVSIVVGFILLLKRVFEDKLSPRWQYSIWTLLAIRILVPVNLAKYIIPQVALWTELLKEQSEKMLHSNYSEVFQPITLHHVLPVISGEPQSITDWFFVIYAVGIVFFLLKYLTAYIRLRILLKKGKAATSDLEHKMLMVCDKYGLNPCKIVVVEGLSSAFICGVLRPVLVVPQKDELDEKVILHELLHLKYCDTIQNIGWCILRSLHWCNPLIHYVINHIENDMESLCDQRVLELLEGEERREYGTILLNMANQKYARIPGTTSISNGGNNISKRIAAIVRFKKYPQGMALVSVCIILIMFWPTIIGTAATYDSLDYIYYHDSMDKSMAIARINRCGTVAGAIDMYAKGVYQMNGAYVASASSLSEHARISDELEKYGCYQPGEYVGEIDDLFDFYIYNLEQVSEKEYTATICYLGVVKEQHVYILIPIKIVKEDAWVVEETAERSMVPVVEYVNEIVCPKNYYGRNNVGEINLEIQTKYEINHEKSDMSPNLNAKFSYYTVNRYATYTHLTEEAPRNYIKLAMDSWETSKDISDWTGSISGGGGGGYSMDADVEEIEDLPNEYTAKLNIDGVDMPDIILKEVKECANKNN